MRGSREGKKTNPLKRQKKNNVYPKKRKKKGGIAGVTFWSAARIEKKKEQPRKCG